MRLPGLVAAASAIVLTACTAQHAGTGPDPATAGHPGSASNRAAPTGSSRTATTGYADGGVPLGQAPCVVDLPAAWSASMRGGTLWRAVWDHHPTGAPAPDGAGVLYQADSGTVSHVAIIGRDHKTVADIGTIPNPLRQGQITYNAIDDDYAEFVFAPSNGQEASFRWDIYLWNRRTHRLIQVAHNPVDSSGHALSGGWVQPELTSRYLTWIQASPDSSGWGGSALMQYSLATGTTRVLYRGLATSFVTYGSAVLLARLAPGAARPTPTTQSNGPPLRLSAIDSVTGKAVAAPRGLSFAAENPNTVVTNGDLVAWSTDEVIRAWRPGWHKSITIVPSPDAWPAGQRLNLSGPTYPRLYRNLLVWNAGATYVLDLSTDTVARLEANPGGDELSGSQLSLEPYTTATSFDRATERYQFDQVLVDLRGLPALPGCHG